MHLHEDVVKNDTLEPIILRLVSWHIIDTVSTETNEKRRSQLKEVKANCKGENFYSVDSTIQADRVETNNASIQTADEDFVLSLIETSEHLNWLNVTDIDVSDVLDIKCLRNDFDYLRIVTHLELWQGIIATEN